MRAPPPKRCSSRAGPRKQALCLCDPNDDGTTRETHMTGINRRQAAWLLGWMLCLAFLVTAPAARSADWVPSKPIRLILPYAPGGTTDLIARILSGPLGSDLGQQIVID